MRLSSWLREIVVLVSQTNLFKELLTPVSLFWHNWMSSITLTFEGYENVLWEEGRMVVVSDGCHPVLFCVSCYYYWELPLKLGVAITDAVWGKWPEAMLEHTEPVGKEQRRPLLPKSRRNQRVEKAMMEDHYRSWDSERWWYKDWRSSLAKEKWVS